MPVLSAVIEFTVRELTKDMRRKRSEMSLVQRERSVPTLDALSERSGWSYKTVQCIIKGHILPTRKQAADLHEASGSTLTFTRFRK